MLTAADQFGIPDAPAILEQVRDALGDWHTFAKKAGLTQQNRDNVAKSFNLIKSSSNQLRP